MNFSMKVLFIELRSSIAHCNLEFEKKKIFDSQSYQVLLVSSAMLALFWEQYQGIRLKLFQWMPAFSLFVFFIFAIHSCQKWVILYHVSSFLTFSPRSRERFFSLIYMKLKTYFIYLIWQRLTNIKSWQTSDT